MQVKSILLLTALIASPAIAVNAQESGPRYQAGINYTSFGYTPEEKESDKQAAAEAPQTPQTPTPPKKAVAPKPVLTPAAQTTDPQTESEEIRIWNKYKELATGQSEAQKEGKEETENKQAADKNSQPMKKLQVAEPEKKSPSQAASQQQASGIAAILNDWKNNREQQREMRSMRFSQPKELESENQPKTEDRTEAE